MKNITKQLLDNLFTIDIENGIFIWKNPSKYHLGLKGKEAGLSQPSRNKSYWVIKINNKKYKRARLLFFYVYGYFPSPCIDHINGNSLDDSIKNLRQASILENCWNHKTRKKKSDLPMGIRLSNGKYVARISFKKKTIHIGTFDNLKDAHNEYINKRKQLYGQFSGI
jgi:hypothetical protein